MVKSKKSTVSSNDTKNYIKLYSNFMNRYEQVLKETEQKQKEILFKEIERKVENNSKK